MRERNRKDEAHDPKVKGVRERGACFISRRQREIIEVVEMFNVAGVYEKQMKLC